MAYSFITKILHKNPTYMHWNSYTTVTRIKCRFAMYNVWGFPVPLSPSNVYDKTWNFGYIQAPQSESAQHKWSSWMSNCKLLSYLCLAKSAPCSSSPLFWRYGQFCVVHFRGSRSLQNLVAISQRYYGPVLISKAGCKGNNGKNWLGTSSLSEGYRSKWLIWLVCREPLHLETFVSGVFSE